MVGFYVTSILDTKFQTAVIFVQFIWYSKFSGNYWHSGSCKVSAMLEKRFMSLQNLLQSIFQKYLTRIQTRKKKYLNPAIYIMRRLLVFVETRRN